MGEYCDFSHTLYVIFHGAWAFYDMHAEGCIHVYAPDTDDHSYLAGSWLGETKIPRGTTLRLENVDPPDGTKTHCVNGHPEGFILLPYQQACPVGAYAEVRLPFPLNIYPEEVVPFSGGDATNSAVTVKYPPGTIKFPATWQLGLDPVFEFRFTEVPALYSLPQHSDPPYWKLPTKNFNGPATLHFFAADDTNKATENADDDFAKAAALLGVYATLDSRAVTGKTTCRRIPGMDGREWEYTTNLFDRLDRLRGMGYQMQLGNLTCLNWEMPLPLPRLGFGMVVNSASCGGAGGGS